MVVAECEQTRLKAKAEAKTEELKSSTLVACLSKNSATRTATSVLNGMECLEYGFNEEQTNKLLHGQAVNHSGLLHSNEYRCEVLADNVTAQLIRDEKRNLFLHINETPIAQWFKEQFGIGQEQWRGLRR